MNRRDILRGGIIAGAAVALPSRASSLIVPRMPASPSAATPYHRRILDVAAREKDRVRPHLWRTDIVGVADFAQPSSMPRFHFANLENGTVRSIYVSHGRGSDPQHDGWLKFFSNTPGSEATSRGAYLTCEWYTGKYGTSIRLVGLDPDNSQALDRTIVVHPAWYADPAMVDKWGKLGRSEGCFALPPDQFNNALLQISAGRLIFADRIGAG